MNETQTVIADTEIAEVEELIIEDGDDAETIKSKTLEWKTKVDDRNKQLYARTKKAEGFILVDGKYVKQTTENKNKPADSTTTDPNGNLNSKDMYALMQANVAEEDIDEVVEYATLKKISVADAIKSNYITSFLKTKAEERATANGTSTGTQARSSARLTDEALVNNANKGIFPENDDDIERLIAIQRAKR